MRQLNLQIEALAPLAFPERKRGIQFNASLPYVPGAALYGALGQQLGPAGFDAALFRALRCHNAYPSRAGDAWVRPLPATAITPKNAPSDQPPEDALYARVAWEIQQPPALIYAPTDDGRPWEAAEVGFYTLAANHAPARREVQQRVLTRVAINPQRGTAQDSRLYSPLVLSEVDSKAHAPTVFRPGASLKGAFRARVEALIRSVAPGEALDLPEIEERMRAQCERICRSLDGPERYDRAKGRRKEGEFIPPLADNPLIEKGHYQEFKRGGDDLRFSSGIYFEQLKGESEERIRDTAMIYRRSSLIQIFGHTSLAGRVRFADAYSDDLKPEHIEERNGVAIDRVYGSVAVGPFNYETVVGGSFKTRIDLKNLTLAQLRLLGLALRDLAEGRVAIGFGKSRGLGRVKVSFDEMRLFYPTCELKDGQLTLLNSTQVVPANRLAGLGALCTGARFEGYALPPKEQDQGDLPAGLAYAADEFLGVELRAAGDEQVRSVWRACMPAWRREIGL